ncbi:MAG: NADH:flavin oxidoreductase [Anaerolineaceae bacterium]|nr:NADH:flavin oxidoreductase [Anaerolineaceae bacterium]
MNKLFEPGKIGTLELPNRLVRSATAERMATEDGYVTPKLKALYKELAEGGVGLIISGHMYVHPGGKCHPEMTAVYDDKFIPGLSELADTVHQAGGKVVVQINHGGLQSSEETVADPIAPSTVDEEYLARPAREITTDEIETVIKAYGQAARRVKEAGFDGVQIHGAHGYLVSQFLSPLTNQRTDRWGGSLEKRIQFLRDVAAAVREQVGPDYPVLIKLGMMDGVEGGLALEESVQVVAALDEMGIRGVEISGAFGGKLLTNIQKGVKVGKNEAYFLDWAEKSRPASDQSIILVGGFRSKKVMEEVLGAGTADFISICRPLICEPDLPERMRLGLQIHSICISANLCHPKNKNEGVACRCKVDRDLREGQQRQVDK